MTAIKRTFESELPSPFDEKVVNYVVDRLNQTVTVESIEDYLLRIIPDIRPAGTQVAVLVPKAGYDILSSYPFAYWPEATTHFDVKYYAFVGGIADEDFIEVRNSFIVAGRLIDISDPIVIVTFPFIFNSIPIGDVKVYRYGKPYPEFVGTKRMDVLYILADENWLTKEGFTIEIDSEGDLSGVIVEYTFIQQTT